MTDKITVRNAAQLIAAIPHITGYYPHNRTVMLCLSTGTEGPRNVPFTAAIANPELDEVPMAAAALCGGPYEQLRGQTVIIVCFTDDLTLARVMIGSIEYLLEGHATVRDSLICTTDEAILNIDGDQVDQVLDTERDLIAAHSTLAGRAAPAYSREAKEASLIPDPELIEQIQPHLDTHTRDANAAGDPWIITSHAWIQMYLDRYDGTLPTHADAAKIILTLADEQTRHHLIEELTIATPQDNAARIALYTHLIRSTPDHLRAGPALLLAYTAYLSGDGALAWMALDTLPTVETDHDPDAQRLAGYLTNATPPSQWPDRDH